MPTKKKQTAEEKEKEVEEYYDINLAKKEVEKTKESLLEYQKLYEKAIAENKVLKQEVRRRGEDHVQVSGFLQQDVEQRTTKANKLQQELFDQRRKYEDEIRVLQQKLIRQQKDFENQLIEKDEIIQEQDNTLLQFERIKREKQILDKVLSDKNIEVSDIRKYYEEKITNINLAFVAEKVKMEEREQQFRLELEADLKQKAMESLGERAKEIFEENKLLRKEMKKVEAALKEMRDMKTKLSQRNAILERESRISKDTIKNHAKRGVRLTQEVNELSEKCRAVQSTLTNLVQKHMYEKETTQEIQNVEMEAYKSELHELKTVLKVRTTELFHLKKLAKRVVKQRSALEQFFMEALQHVKQQKVEEIIKKQESESLPPIGNRRGSRKVIDHVKLKNKHQSFSKLTWEDKEKVIKLLFAQINGQEQSLPSPVSIMKSRVNTAATLESRKMDSRDGTFITESSSRRLNPFPDDSFAFDDIQMKAMKGGL